MPSVLDACAMLAYLNNEAGADIVEALLADPNEECYAHAINLCEVFYTVLRETTASDAYDALRMLKADGVVTRRDMSERFCREVGSLKSRGRISMADCFVLALANHVGGQALTSDHKEFDPLVPLDICPIRFIR